MISKARSITTIASQQNGVFSRHQAISAGVTDKTIQYSLESGEWIRLSNGVYSIDGTPPSWERRLRSAILSHPIALIAGSSAAHLLGFPGFPRSGPEVLVPFQGNARSDAARVIRTRRFERVSRIMIRDFPATSVAETILTLAASNPTSVIERLVDSQLASKKLNTIHFDPIFEDLAYARVRGLPALKRIVRARDSDAYQPPTSELERYLQQLLDMDSVPPSSTQQPFDFKRTKATVDAFISSWNLIVEADGRRWHTREKDFERDRLRDNEAAAAGYRVLRFSYRMLVHEAEQCHRTLVEVGKWRVTT